MNQNSVSRLENPEYGKPTLTTLKRLAAAFDVALVVRFVPFSKLVNWVSGTPFIEEGLSTESLVVTNFNEEEEKGVLDEAPKLLEVVAGTVAPTYFYGLAENLLDSVQGAPFKVKYDSSFVAYGIGCVGELNKPLYLGAGALEPTFTHTKVPENKQLKMAS
jgi:transcriptional regulator with XRE-family HTH domain